MVESNNADLNGGRLSRGPCHAGHGVEVSEPEPPIRISRSIPPMITMGVAARPVGHVLAQVKKTFLGSDCRVAMPRPDIMPLLNCFSELLLLSNR